MRQFDGVSPARWSGSAESKLKERCAAYTAPSNARLSIPTFTAIRVMLPSSLPIQSLATRKLVREQAENEQEMGSPEPRTLAVKAARTRGSCSDVDYREQTPTCEVKSYLFAVMRTTVLIWSRHLLSIVSLHTRIAASPHDLTFQARNCRCGKSSLS